MSMAARERFALDRSSARTYDENGFLHVAKSHITKAVVNGYYGYEIPGWEERGLDRDKLYYGYRAPEELKKSLPTWAGLPLHLEHHVDSAKAPSVETRVGNVGTEVEWNAPYVNAPLTVWNQEAIDHIQDGTFRELSCAYRYDPDWTPGEADGRQYDFVMRNIRGNHVALVEEGRAGHDVLVADHNAIGRDDGFKESDYIRNKDGKFAGSTGGSSNEKVKEIKPDSSGKIKITGKEFGDYKNNDELRSKVKVFYKENLQGTSAHREDIGDVRFSGKGLKETLTYSVERDKLLVIPALRSIIETGKLGETEPLKHKRNDRTTSFVPVTRDVEVEGRQRKVEALLGKDMNGNYYYDLFFEKRKNESPESNLKHNPGLHGDSADESAYELNLRFLDEPVNRAGEIGGNMPTDKKLATDSDPNVEQKEVDLAQAIIDLHKVDPNTGEVMDIQEDEGPVAAVKEAIDGLELSPEDMKKLCDALAALKFAPPAGDEEPAAAAEEGEPAPAADEDTPAADEDDPVAKAMDECGFDSDNEELRAAFEAGFKAAEKGDEPVEGEACNDEEPAAPSAPAAADKKPAPKKARRMPAMDANVVRRKVMGEMKALYGAVEKVRPLCGSLQPMSFDSANGVYAHALKCAGLDPSKYDRAAWAGMVDVLISTRANNGKTVAADSKPVNLDGDKYFGNLKNMIIG